VPRRDDKHLWGRLRRKRVRLTPATHEEEYAYPKPTSWGQGGCRNLLEAKDRAVYREVFPYKGLGRASKSERCREGITRERKMGILHSTKNKNRRIPITTEK